MEHFSKALRDALTEDNHAKTLQLCKLAKQLPKGTKQCACVSTFLLHTTKASYDVFYDLILDFFSVGNQYVQLAAHAIEDELLTQSTISGISHRL